MLNPALKSATDERPAERTMLRVIDSGVVPPGSNPMAQFRVTLNAMALDGIRFLLIPEHDHLLTHWWLLQMKSGDRQVFVGNPRSFEMFQVNGKDIHAYEFGYEGLKQ